MTNLMKLLIESSQLWEKVGYLKADIQRTPEASKPSKEEELERTLNAAIETRVRLDNWNEPIIELQE